MTKSLCDSCVNKNCRWRAETVSNDPPVMDCTDFKTKITNADKIRSMTDEELAKWLSVHYECLNCEADESGTGYCNNVCWKILLDWLKKEANND